MRYWTGIVADVPLDPDNPGDDLPGNRGRHVAGDVDRLEHAPGASVAAAAAKTRRRSTEKVTVVEERVRVVIDVLLSYYCR